MNIAFAGLRHAHIWMLADLVRSHPDTAVAGYWEEDGDARREAAQRFREPAYDSWEALLADPQVQAVAVGDYYGVRGRRILQALEAGKHVLSDKPLCTSPEELDAIEALCRRTGLRVGCMLDLRYDPALRLAQSVIQSGRLGEIHALSFTGQHPLQWGARPMWYFEEGKHGGTFNDIAVHGLDAVRMITGLTCARIRYTRQWNAFARSAPAFCDCAQFAAEMTNGAGLMADVSYAAPDPAAFSLPSYWRFTFWGQNGWLECRLGEGAVSVALNGDSAPRTLPAAAAEGSCLTDWLEDIAGKPTPFDTASVLAAARAALELQLAADKAGKDESK